MESKLPPELEQVMPVVIFKCTVQALLEIAGITVEFKDVNADFISVKGTKVCPFTKDFLHEIYYAKTKLFESKDDKDREKVILDSCTAVAGGIQRQIFNRWNIN